MITKFTMHTKNMSRVFSFVLIVGFVAIGHGSVDPRALGRQSENPALEITHRARAMTPGEVILVDVSIRGPSPSPEPRVSSPEVVEVRGEWLGRSLVFYQLEPRRWQGLAPIDVGAKSGQFTLVVSAKTAGGTLRRSYPITVAPKTFPSRSIRVPPEFAEPPAEVLPRIAKEREIVEAILARTTLERFWTEPFVTPVPGAATSSFGRRTILNGLQRGPHTGTDFQAATGTPVVAPNRGRVVLAADHYFAGRTVIIDHGLGVYTYLAHNSEFLVQEGTIVDRGQKIALAGATGRVTGPHVHWALRLAGARIDPMALVALHAGDEGGR
jgi:murein DD-endopeptidase MepM/ murein hydrolase activator NlpD